MYDFSPLVQGVEPPPPAVEEKDSNTDEQEEGEYQAPPPKSTKSAKTGPVSDINNLPGEKVGARYIRAVLQRAESKSLFFILFYFFY